MNAPDKLEFLRRRQAGLGGSDIAAVLGISPYKTPLDVYHSKVVPITPDDVQDMSEAAYWGTALESLVAQEYAKRTGHTIQRITAQLKHPKHNWLVANLDRVAVTPGSRARIDSNGELKGAEFVLEVKTASAYKASDWGRDGEEDAIPLHYQAQGMGYLAVTGLPYCEFAALIGGQKFVIKRLERDEETIKAILEQLEAFWFDNVVARKEPAPINSTDVAKLFPNDNGQAIEASTEALIAYNEAITLRQQIKDAEDDLEKRMEVLKMTMGESAVLASNGKPLMTWRAPKPSIKVNWEAAALAAGATLEQIASFTKQVPNSRRINFVKQ
jgi:putative phage-type endonuclease